MNPTRDSSDGDPIRNPYATPAASLQRVTHPLVGDEATREEAERIRRENIGHEASVKSIGGLYLLGGFLGLLGMLGSLVGFFFQLRSGSFITAQIIVMVATFLLSIGTTVLQICLGFGLRGLKPWARWGTILLTALGLLYFMFVIAVSTIGGGMPIGVLVMLLFFAAIPAYILWLLAGAKGRFLFTPEYRAICELTPEIKYKTSIIVKIAIGFLLGFIVFAIILFLVAASRP